jgi:hypothetical protein
MEASTGHCNVTKLVWLFCYEALVPFGAVALFAARLGLGCIEVPKTGLKNVGTLCTGGGYMDWRAGLRLCFRFIFALS